MTSKGARGKDRPATGLDLVQLDVEHLERTGRDRSIREPEKEFGRRLARMREDRELSQEQLSHTTKAHDAEGVGISRAVISMYERGKNRPSTRELRILCDTLHVTPSELLYGDAAPFDIDRWQVLGRRTGDALYFARWLLLLSRLDAEAQLALYGLVIQLARPTKKQLDALDNEGRALLLRLADELLKNSTPK